MYRGIIRAVVLFVMTACLPRLHGQTIDWDRVEQHSASAWEPCIAGRCIYPTWMNGCPFFYYNVRKGDSTRYYLVDARNGRKIPMVKDVTAFTARYASLTGDSLDRNDFRLHGLTFNRGDVRRFFLRHRKGTLVYDLRRGTLAFTDEQPDTDGVPPHFRQTCHSADSAFTMLGSGHDLYVRNNRTGTVRRLTTDGREGASYTYRACVDTVPSNIRGCWMGHRYVCLLQDMSEVQDISLINSLGKGRPQTLTFQMPMPGDEGVRRYRLFWYNADTDEARLLPIDKYPDQTVELDHFSTGEALYFTRRSRTADCIDLCRVNLADGTVDELISETTRPHINLTLMNHLVFRQGRYILWWSERTGRGNYYLYDGEGRLLHRVTRGDRLVAGRIVRVDTVRNELLFAGYGEDPQVNPCYTYYYKASLDGTRQVLLTPGNGNHELSLSHDGRYAIDRCSRVDCPPTVRVLSIDHPSRSFEVDRMDESALRAAGWQPPTPVKVKAADGVTDLYGVMYVPSTLDPARKYPLITNVYPGPQDDQLPLSFVVDDNGNQSLAELGFVVINVSVRGSSPLRGRDFYCYGYGNLRDYPLPDTRHVVEELASRYPFIDLDRVGIYGHSGGAFQTVAAMLTYPDFFKVGVAASGNHDNNIYIQWWGETFHGVTAETDSVDHRTRFRTHIPTNMELADRLQGDLLLITGDMDRNVPPSSTYRMAHALIQAHKRSDFFILPGKDHGVMDDYYLNLIRYYFVEHLLHPTRRDIDIINHH